MRPLDWIVVALALFIVACSFASAEPPGPQAEPTAAQARYALAAPASWRGITVWPVVDREAQETPVGDYRTLAEALGDGTLVVSELDASGSVPSLEVHNTGDKAILLTAGEVVKGGKQDRVLTQDVLIEPSAEPQQVAVNCVEQGRWSAGRTGLSFGYGGKAEVALTQAIQGEQDQGTTWQTVAKLNAEKAKALEPAGAQALQPSTGTYMASLEEPQVQGEVATGVATLAPAFTDQEKVVGLVVAVDGKLSSAELYGHPRLFEKSRDQALRSAALRGIASPTRAPGEPLPLAAAQAFLDEALAADVPEEAAEVDGKVRRKAAKSKGAAAYKTEDAAGELLHVTVYAE